MAFAKMENIEELDQLAISRFHKVVGEAKNGPRDKSTSSVTDEQNTSKMCDTLERSSVLTVLDFAKKSTTNSKCREPG